MMLNGLQSNPNLPGVEKFVLADVNEKWLQSKSMRISSGEVGADQGLVPPQSLFAAKGWNRSVCAMLVMVDTYELGDALLKDQTSSGTKQHIIVTNSLRTSRLAVTEGNARGCQAAQTSVCFHVPFMFNLTVSFLWERFNWKTIETHSGHSQRSTAQR